MKRVTSITTHTTAEGQRISFTYSEIEDTTGKLVAQNVRENFIVVDPDVQGHIDALTSYVTKRLAN